MQLADTLLFADANLQEYWKLEDLTGKNATTLTNINSVTFTSALYNNGANMGASNTSAFLKETASDFNIHGGTISMVCWVKMLTELTSGTQMFFAHFTTTGQIQSLLYYYMNGSTLTIGADRKKQGVSDQVAEFPAILGTSVFHHMALVYDSAAQTLKLFFDGTLVVTTTSVTGSGNTGTIVGAAIGAWFALPGTDSSGGLFSQALIDDAAIFNRVLTPAEIALLAANGHFLSPNSKFW